jgi:hypothetical protein
VSAKTRIRHSVGGVLGALTVGGLLLGTGPAASAASAGTLTAPSNLHVVSETFTDLNLAWDASTSRAGSGVSYELFVDNNVYPKFPLETPSVDVQLGPEFGLTPGTTHTFQVEAFGDGTGSKAFSNKLTVTLGPGDTTAPTAPANLHVVSMNADGVTLGWDASSDPDSPDITYFVYNPCGLTTTSTEAVIPSETANPVCGISAGSTHTIQIFARDPSSNQSPLSNPVTFTFTP